MKSLFANDCHKVYIGGHSEPQLVSKLLLQFSVRELHNSIVGPPEEGGLKKAVDSDNNIIISDYTLQSIIPPQLKNMSERHKVMCGLECCIYAKSIHSSLLSWRDLYLRKLNYLSQNAQNRRSGEKSNNLF